MRSWISIIEYEFDQLEELKQDVFDLRLELKLSKDKIKSGNFNMVKIYLDGLTPRVQKMWDKLGKQPKKVEIQLLDTSEMDAELAKAKEEKKKAEAKEKGGGEGGGTAQTAPEPAPAAPAEEKKEAAPAPQKVETKEQPTQQQPQQAPGANPASQFSALIAKAKQAVAAKNKALAGQIYNQMRSLYKDIPQQQKTAAYQHILNVNKQISALR
jgi:hypothetical protein